jgi:hypothetical protein
MTKEEVIEYLKDTNASFRRALNDPSRQKFIDGIIASEMKYLNSDYGKKHLYPEIPIDEVD